MNAYLSDATLFFKHLSRGIREEATEFEVILLALQFALGIERVLKGILYDINPLFILLEPDFRNAVNVQYRAKIIHGMEQSSELAKTTNADVITYRNSLLRGQHFSEVISQNKAMLFYLSEARDIIVHHRLSRLDVGRLRMILFRDYFPLVHKIADEFNIPMSKVFDGQDFRLSELSAKNQTDVKTRLEMMFESHAKKLHMLKGNVGYEEDKEHVTKDTLLKEGMIPYTCPACNNTAIIYTKPILEYNSYEKKEIQTGQEIRKLKCHYCKLSLDGYEEIDYLGLYDSLASSRSANVHPEEVGDASSIEKA